MCWHLAGSLCWCQDLGVGDCELKQQESYRAAAEGQVVDALVTEMGRVLYGTLARPALLAYAS
eukprot:1154973-Pelagomonas_calceolata.AAC.2